MHADSPFFRQYSPPGVNCLHLTPYLVNDEFMWGMGLASRIGADIELTVTWMQHMAESLHQQDLMGAPEGFLVLLVCFPPLMVSYCRFLFTW